jgi:hypothetical protein
MSYVQMDADWLDNVLSANDHLFTGTLGPRITEDAQRYCPVETGALRDSIEDSMNGHTLIVSATGGAGGRTYAAWVELGHRVFHPSTGIVGPERVAAEPFLRPALYMVRG